MKIGVLGVGTVGVVSLCHLIKYFPNSQIYSIYDPDVKTLGIGESTNIQIPHDLYHGGKFNLLENADDLDATVKYGVRYKNWRSKDFYSHIQPPSYGIHFNNFKLKDVIFKNVHNRITEIKGSVNNIQNNKDNVIVDVSGITYDFDYLIDCRGYPTDYSDYDMIDCLPLNHALVHTIQKPGDWDYTYHLATKHGWTFGIPLKTRQGWGYLFNDNITSLEEAKKDLANNLKIKVNDLSLREFSFKPYRSKKFIDNRILRNGNRAAFFEPLEALSGAFYDKLNRGFYEYIHGANINIVNDRLNYYSEQYINFICFIYSQGSIYDTEFWKITKDKTSNYLKNSESWEITKSYIKKELQIKNDGLYKEQTFPFVSSLWKNLAEGFNYEF